MEITEDQLQQLIVIIRNDQGLQMDRRMHRTPEPEDQFIYRVLREEYGVTGIRRTPEYEAVVRDYLPSEWRARPGAPRLEFDPGGGSPVPPYQSQILADLDTLRRSPLAAAIYILARAAGCDNATAMNLARLGQAVAGLLLRAVPIAGAFSRSISPTTGRVRTESTPQVARVMPRSRGASWAQQQLYQRDLQQRGLGERPAAGDRSRPQPAPHLLR